MEGFWKLVLRFVIMEFVCDGGIALFGGNFC